MTLINVLLINDVTFSCAKGDDLGDRLEAIAHRF
jgi:hypothetical protein